MDKAIKKFICVFLGHKIESKSCPVTHAKIVKCLRCGLGNKNSHNDMSFS